MRISDHRTEKLQLRADSCPRFPRATNLESAGHILEIYWPNVKPRANLERWTSAERRADLAAPVLEAKHEFRYPVFVRGVRGYNKSWTVLENKTSGYPVMISELDLLTGVLLQAVWRWAPAFWHRPTTARTPTSWSNDVGYWH